ncbi:hypothetical protein TSUD_365860 [Trifolium subterraneum]|uniref:Retrotransposon gag domain-containing protein n=1 Tax=Trifolium subterraneum TaxID=3900 RepID=A0A2Z6PH43_TRISU|nr:hypothetical protein TSUD_365860 [Trifolium subterraneum]
MASHRNQDPNHNQVEGHGAATLQTAVEEIRSLQRKIANIEKEKVDQHADSDDESLVESQPLRQSLWNSKVPDSFKSPHLPTFDGKTDPLEHLMAVGTHTAIIGAPEHLKCKLLSGTFKDAALRWYMNLPKNSIESYADFHKFIHQFSGTKHIKVTATSLFAIRQNFAETLREYLARFSEAMIKVVNLNQEMFVAAFQNGLKDGHFNESLAQKPATSMQEIIKRASCYIKGEESNSEKRSRDAKEKYAKGNNNKGQSSQPQRNWHGHDSHRQGYHNRPYNPPNNDRGMSYPHQRRYPGDRDYTPLNRARVHVLHKILQAGLTPLPQPRAHNTIMGPNSEAWCAYHRCKGHDTEHCFRLRDFIEDLIRNRHLRKFLEDAAKGQIALPKQIPYPPKGGNDGGNKGEKQRVAVNTISGGFAGGGKSNSARKRYVRHWERDLSHHSRNLVQCGRWARPDILYWEAFKAMHLSNDQLKPYSGTLVGFAGEQVDVMGHTTLYTTFGEESNAKTVKGAIMSTLYLAIKYPLNNGKIGVVRGDQTLARKCYESSFKIRHKANKPPPPRPQEERTNEVNTVNATDLDLREEFQDRRVSPIEDLELVQISEKPHQTTNIGTNLQPAEREKIITLLHSNRDLLAWLPLICQGLMKV